MKIHSKLILFAGNMALGLSFAALAEIRKPLTIADDAHAQITRIKQLDDAGPRLNAVLIYDPQAPAKASEADGRSLLAGRTVLVKDNIETKEWPTTAGSLALRDNATHRDAPLIENLRAAGGIVLGKTNLSEWANFRDDHSTSGWSAVGGLTKNPHAIDRNTCGSSAGSGAAVAAGFSWGAIGTETNGSIICPASANGIVGFKPSVGLVSRTHIVPISAKQDTAGPMSHTVRDAALLLSAIAGSDTQDPVTLAVPNRRTNYAMDLSSFSLDGVRLGVMRNQIGSNPHVQRAFATALADLQQAGAILIDIEFSPDHSMSEEHYYVLAYEFREAIGSYLQSLPGKGLPNNLDHLIAFNAKHAAQEMRFFGQSVFHYSAAANDKDRYQRALTKARALPGAKAIDSLLTEHRVQFLLAPSLGPAWTSDLVNGDHFTRGIGFGGPAARAGYPHLTVPMGAVEGLPVGLSFIGAKWQDHSVLKVGAAYEDVRSAALAAPSFKRWSQEQLALPGTRPN